MLGATTWRCDACGSEPSELDGFLSFAPELKDSDDCYAMEIIDELARLEAQNFWFRSRNNLIVWAIQKYFPQLSSFFEVGCGNGFVLTGIQQAFPDVQIFGCDAMIQPLAYAKKRVPNAHLYQMDARNSPFEESFDVVGAFDVLEHIEEDELVLKDMYKTLKPGGGILITVPRYMGLWSRCDDFVKHVRRYEPGELEIKLTRCGFQMVRGTCFVSFLLPLLVASRIWQHISPRPYDLVSELRVQGVVGGILETILNVERRCIGKGLSPSIGGSLLAIAVKPR